MLVKASPGFVAGDVVRTPMMRRAEVIQFEGDGYTLRYLDEGDDLVTLKGTHLRLLEKSKK